MANRRIPAPDGDVGNWGNLLNDYLRQISDVSAGNVVTNSSAFRGGINQWTNETRPTQIWSYTKTGGAGNETLGTDHTGLTGINTTTGQLEKWNGTGWNALTYPNLVSNSNNIGVGLTSPVAKLHLDGGNATATNLKITAGTTTGQNATDGLDIGIDAAGNGEIRQRENLDIGIFTNNLTRVTVKNSGNVGIGTTSPNSLLDLGQNGANATSSTTQSSSGILSLTGSYWTGSAETKNRFTLQNIASANTNNSGLLGFLWNSTELLTLDNNGIVRIASSTASTTSTTGALIVAGGVGINENLNVGGKTTTSTLQITTGAAAGRVLTSDASGNATWAVASGGGGSTTPAGSNTQIQFNNNGAFGASSNLVWDNGNGRLGVGTDTPSEKLEIAGAIKISGDQSITYNANNLVLEYSSGFSKLISSGPDTSTTGGFDFVSRNSTASLNHNVLRITNAGYVGISGQTDIGNFFPNSSLDIGQAGATSSSTATQKSSGIITLTGSYWSGTAETKGRFTFQNIASTTANNSGRLAINWNSSEFFTIASGGNVGVGATSPTSGNGFVGRILEVAGGTNNSVVVASSSGGSGNGMGGIFEARSTASSLTGDTRLGQISFTRITDVTTNKISSQGIISVNNDGTFLNALFINRFGAVNLTSTTTSTTSTTGALTVAGGVGIAGALNVGGGYMALANGTSNLLAFANNGLGAPTFTTRSTGTKILLWNGMTSSIADYAIGIESNNMWFSISNNNSALGFKWYGGTTNIATLDGTGNLTLANKITAPSLQVTTGAAAGRVLTSDASGNATWATSSAATTASNGLTATSGNISLGGTLTGTTTLTGTAANRLHVQAPFYVGPSANLGSQTATYYDSFRTGGTNSGLLLAWNINAGKGEANLVASRGAGSTGGFGFYDLPTTAGSTPNHLMTIEGGGNVGIGTTAPTYKLTVAGGAIGLDNANAIAAKDSAGTYRTAMIPRWTNNALYLDGGTGGTYLRTNESATVNMYLATNGNVGVGTLTPNSLLQVGTRGSSVLTNNSTIGVFGGSGTGILTNLTLHNNATAAVGNGSSLSFTLSTAYSATASIGAVIESTVTAASSLIFSTYVDNTTLLTEKMRILGNGNVGVGTSSPAAKLSVVSGTQIGGSGFSTAMRVSAGTIAAAAGSELNLASFGGMSGNNTGLTVSLYKNGATNDWANTAILLNYDVDNSKRAGGYISMYNSKVGINLTAPTQALDVNGSIKASGYVFAQYLNTTQPIESTASFTPKDFPIRTTDNYIRMFSASETRNALGVGNSAIFSPATGSGATAIALGSNGTTAAGIEIRAITTSGAPNSVGTAHISFHRPGLFAANFGLDTDNSFAFGGWSSGSGYTTVKVGHLHTYGNFHNVGGYVYPGRADASGAVQTSWYLGSHGTYGLWTNTGFYAAGGMHSGGAINTINNITPTNGAIRISASSALHLNSGATAGVYLNWDSGVATTGTCFAVGNGANTSLLNVNYDGYLYNTGTLRLGGAGGVKSDGNAAAVAWNSVEPGQGTMEFIDYCGSGGAFAFTFFRVPGIATPTTSHKIASINQAGTYTVLSDGRIKKNVQPLQYGLTEILQLQPKLYDHHYNNTFQDGGVVSDGKFVTKLGLIAQEVYAVIPEIVFRPADETREFYNLDYTSLVPVLIKAVQEQQLEIETLKQENQELKTKLTQMQTQFDNLAKFVNFQN